MANQIELIYAKQAEEQLKKVLSGLTDIHKKQMDLQKVSIDFYGGRSANSVSDMKKVEVAMQKIQQQTERNRLAEIKLQQDREKAFDKFQAQLDKEAQKLAIAGNYYNKLQSELNSLSFAYKDLAVRQAQGATLTKAEAEHMDYLRNRIQMHDRTLKAVDATMGKYQRNVGNYASAFNPLNNSVMQLTREMPAFANSVQTGFMAISNNLPIFFDAMQNVINQNKELQAQGKPTQSVFKQLAGAIFNFQSLLSVGVVLLTVYGKEIVNWVSSLFGASEALAELNKNQKEFNKSRLEGKKESISDRTELDKYVRTMRNSNISLEERNIALEKLRSQFPFYFKNLTDEQMRTGDIGDNLERLNLALERRGVLNKATEANINNKKRLADLEAELKLTNEKLLLDRKSYEESKKLGIQIGGGTVAGTYQNTKQIIEERYQKTLAKTQKIQSDILAFQTAISNNDKVINELKSLTIGLEYQDKDAKDKKVKTLKELNLELQDYISSEYELLKAQKELNVEANKNIFDSENQTLENRLNAYKRYVEGKIELENDAFVEEKRLLDLSHKTELESLNETYNEYIKQEGVTASQRISAKKELDRAIIALDRKTKADFGLLEVNHSKNILEITKDFYDEQRKLRDKYFGLEKNKEFKEQELRDLQQHQLRLKNINIKTTRERLEQIDDLNEKAQRDLSRKRLQLRVDEIMKELEIVGLSTEAELKLRTELYQKQKEIANLESADLEKKKQEHLAYLDLLKQTYDGFISDFGNQSGFGKMLDIFSGGLDKFKGDAVATALTVSEAFQEAFNTISTMSDANYERMYANLERQRDTAILFAGESTTAKEEIERVYEERRKRIERKQAESQKRLAIFNAVVDTAQGVASAIARADLFPYNFVLAGLIGALGAAQIAMISSQPIPQFAVGTQNAPEGLAWTDEKGAELHTDKNGKIKDLGSNKGARLKKLEKGDKIYTASQTKKMLDLYSFNKQYDNIMLSNGISVTPQVGQTIDFNPLKQEIRDLGSIIKNKSEVTIVNNESGQRYYERVNGQKRELVNSVLTLKTRTIR